MNDGWDCHVHVFDASAPVRDGHYRPVDRPLAQIEAAAQAQGVAHLVLVQPSVYGTDNGVLLRALGVQPGRHRGVVVIDPDVSDDQLGHMHALGVRGVRFNLVSPVGEGDPPADRFAALAPRLRRLGWHVQWYARVEHLAQIAGLHRDSGLTCVLDHLAGIGPDTAADDPAWRTLESLGDQGAWVKLSGWYRCGMQEPYPPALPLIRRLHAMFGARLVWGSDWPHTFFAPDAMPTYASTWQPIADALGAEAATALQQHRPMIYT